MRKCVSCQSTDVDRLGEPVETSRSGMQMKFWFFRCYSCDIRFALSTTIWSRGQIRRDEFEAMQTASVRRRAVELDD